jgi:MFS family permease
MNPTFESCRHGDLFLDSFFLNRVMLQKKKLLGIASFRIINSFRNGIIYVYMALYLREQLLLPVTLSNLLFTLIEFIGALGQFLIWGYLADRYQARNSLIIVGEAVPAIGYLGVFILHRYLLQTSSPSIAGLSLVFGLSAFEFFWGAGFTGFYALLADLPSAKDRARYQSLTISLASAGTISGTLIGGVLYDYKCPGCGFENGILFFLLSSIIMGFVALSWLTRKETEVKYQDIDQSSITSSELSSSEPSSPITPSKSREVTNIRVFYWFLAAIVIGTLARGAIGQITMFYLRLPDSIALSSIAVSLVSTSRWVAHLFSGLIASRISAKKAPYLYMLTLVWFAILPLLLPLTSSVNMAIILFASRGLVMGISSVSSFVLISRIIPPEKRGKLLGQWNAAQMVAWGAGGTLIGGPLADWRISQGAGLADAYTFVFIFVFLMGVVGIILTLWKAREVLCYCEKNWAV